MSSLPIDLELLSGYPSNIRVELAGRFAVDIRENRGKSRAHGAVRAGRGGWGVEGIVAVGVHLSQNSRSIPRGNVGVHSDARCRYGSDCERGKTGEEARGKVMGDSKSKMDGAPATKRTRGDQDAMLTVKVRYGTRCL